MGGEGSAPCVAVCEWAGVGVNLIQRILRYRAQEPFTPLSTPITGGEAHPVYSRIYLSSFLDPERRAQRGDRQQVSTGEPGGGGGGGGRDLKTPMLKENVRGARGEGAD